MGHEISLVDNAYVLVRPFGAITRDDRETICAEIVSTITKTGVFRVLVDHSDSQLNVTTSESYEFGKNLQKAMNGARLAHRPRMAIVVPADDRARGDKIFAATVAGNLGLAIEVFPDRNDAVAYLMADTR